MQTKGQVRVAIAGASGYTGAELLRLLVQHPGVRVAALTAETHANQPISHVFPSLRRFVDLTCIPLDPARLAADADFVFLALPHKASMTVAPALLERGVRVLDLSADFRLKDAAAYPAWYGLTHDAPQLLKDAVYGLPEIHGKAITDARLIAVPGCYPTSAILGLAPLLRGGLIDAGTIVIDSISGVSGAGRKPELGTHFSEVNESLKAYGVAKHRHTPEIEQELSTLAGTTVAVTFTPHLAPLTRGILTTITARLARPQTTTELVHAYHEFYGGRPCVRVLDEGALPQTKYVLHSNLCDIGVVSDPRTGRVVVISAIDNLVKGASGQAVQCFNLMAGFEETAGLQMPGLYP